MSRIKDGLFGEDDVDAAYRNIVILELTINNDEVGLESWLQNPACDVNEADIYGNCAVTIAASNNNFIILELLHAAGAMFDVIDGDENSPLDYAKINNNTAMVNFITACLNKKSNTL